MSVKGTRGLVLLAVLVSVVVVSADSWPMPRPQVFASAYGQYGFKTRPPQHAVWSGTSQGTLFTQRPDGTESPIWSRELVNIPVRAFVTDDGKYVVTIDTWARLGYEHSLVIYGDEGKTIADFALEELLPRDQIAKVVQTVGSRHWLTDGSVAFNDVQDQLVISLRGGQHVIRVTLATGRFEP